MIKEGFTTHKHHSAKKERGKKNKRERKWKF